jgi:hypothetical protein
VFVRADPVHPNEHRNSTNNKVFKLTVLRLFVMNFCISKFHYKQSVQLKFESSILLYLSKQQDSLLKVNKVLSLNNIYNSFVNVNYYHSHI